MYGVVKKRVLLFPLFIVSCCVQIVTNYVPTCIHSPSQVCESIGYPCQRSKPASTHSIQKCARSCKQHCIPCVRKCSVTLKLCCVTSPTWEAWAAQIPASNGGNRT